MADSDIKCPRCFGSNIDCYNHCQQHTCTDCGFVHMPYPDADLHD